MQCSTAIEAKGLTKRFGEVTALKGLDLAVTRGELFGLLGPNGAGKSTTVNLLCGLLIPTSGSASILGMDIRREGRAIRRHMGVCPQTPSEFPYLKGRESIEAFGRLYGLGGGKLRERTESLLDRLGLKEAADRRAGKYSEGMKKRLSLAMSMVHEPDILFLDEPTAAMDPQSRRVVWEFLQESRTEGRTVVLSTHYMEEAERLCDRVTIIDHGSLIALGTPEGLMREHDAEDLEEVFLSLTGRDIRGEV